MRVLHVLPSGGMGWSGGIRPTLRSLADSPLGERHSFQVTGQDDLPTALADWPADLLVWHGACSWRQLPRLLARRQQAADSHRAPLLRRFRASLRIRPPPLPHHAATVLRLHGAGGGGLRRPAGLDGRRRGCCRRSGSACCSPPAAWRISSPFRRRCPAGSGTCVCWPTDD